MSALPDPAAIPAAIAAIPHWVCWRLDPPRKPEGKPTKVPVNAHTGRSASVTKREHLSPLAQALLRAVADKLAGIGFVFTNDNDILGVDIDGCRNAETGEIDAKALEIIRLLNTYTEVSPSGTGVHLLLRGRLEGKQCRKGNVEIYQRDRYFTFTGNRVAGTPAEIEERTEQITALHASIFGSGTTLIDLTAPEPIVSANESDDELIERLASGRSGSKFGRLWSGDTAGYDSPSEADFALCGLLFRATGGDETRIDRLFRQSALMRPKWDKPNGDGTYGTRTIRQLAKKEGKSAQKPGAGPQQLNGSRRIRWLLLGSTAAELVDTAEQVLGAANPAVYQRGPQLVHVAPTIVSEAGDEYAPATGPRITPYTVDGLCDRLDRLFQFLEPARKDGHEDVPTLCPVWLPRRILARESLWKLRSLRGVLQAPTMLASGQVLAAQGYHAPSGFMLDFGGVAFPSVPVKPTSEDVQRATAVLRELVGGFPFADDVDLAVAVSALATAIARPAFLAAPGHAFTAPEMATGKSYLGNAAAYLATGKGASVMTQGPDENEDRKRIFALLAGGASIVMIDNITRPLEGAAFASVLTEETYSDRILGVSKTGAFPTTATSWFFTGNNLVIAGDLRTRILLCRLDAQAERPWQRKFRDNFKDVLRAQRGEIVASLLTIMRAHAVAGYPSHDLPTFGRYEGWTRTVRGALVGAGFEDPFKALARAEALDPESLELQQLHFVWQTFVGEKVATVADCIRFSLREPKPLGSPAMRASDALKELAAGRTRDLDAVRLGKLISKHEKRVRDGRRFERAGSHGGTVRWRLAAVARGDGGEGGVHSTPTNARERAVSCVLEGVGEHPTTPTIPPSSDGSESEGGSAGEASSIPPTTGPPVETPPAPLEVAPRPVAVPAEGAADRTGNRQRQPDLIEGALRNAEDAHV